MPRGPWVLAGVVAGLAALAVSYLVALALTIRESPVVAVAELVIRLTPGAVVEWAIGTMGSADKPVLVGSIIVILLAAFVAAGLLARRGVWRGHVVFLAVTAIGLVAVLSRSGTTVMNTMPVLLGLATWLATFGFLTNQLRRPASAVDTASRRTFLYSAGGVAVVAVGSTLLGRFLGAGRRRVEEARRFLRLDGVSLPRVPTRTAAGVEGVTPWMTPADEFYLIHTAITLPAIEPESWELRIHGLVDREIVVTYQDLIAREISEQWMTLSCVSNPVGGTLVGNAWWSGVRLADLLREAGVQDGADAVLQTSEDGWTCGTPLAALTDDRGAMLALAMNGKVLPIEHGFPVRVIVPGLYGFVSATKWVVDLEVTRFEDFTAFWTDRGWSEQAPVKVASRIDVPGSGDEVASGAVAVGGVAWRQYVGIEAVEVALDGGAWQPVELAGVPSNDTWVQWGASIEVGPGDHTLRVRAKDKTGEWQTGVERDVVPDGSTGWHEVSFSAS